jgi:hypothetical protein
MSTGGSSTPRVERRMVALSSGLRLHTAVAGA